jgi:predicted nucleic acid-binding protein
MLVVDTPVVAYYLLSSPPLAVPAGRFWARVGRTRARLVAPSVWEAEIAEVIAGATRAGVIEPTDAVASLRQVQRLGIESVPSDFLWEAGLVRALRDGTSMRHALFLELAGRHRVPLVTFDSQLLAKFPSGTMRPK